MLLPIENKIGRKRRNRPLKTTAEIAALKPRLPGKGLISSSSQASSSMLSEKDRRKARAGLSRKLIYLKIVPGAEETQKTEVLGKRRQGYHVSMVSQHVQ